jgi:L-asparaginase II
LVDHSRPDEYAGGTASQELPGNPAMIAEVVRGQHVEGRHWGHAVVADISGRVLFAVGDPEHLIFPRSALKPLQALAGIVSGIDNRFRFTDAELAVICGSHRAEPRHRAAVRSILAKVGAAEEHLHCGPHPVMDIATRDELIRCGQTPTPIYNNCSGKHAGMLALAKVLGAPIDGYWNIDHPVQKTIQGICRDLCGVDDASMLDWAVDGCAVPTYLLTLRQLARGFARLCAPEHLEQDYAAACFRLSAAMMTEPEMVGGIDARDSVLMRQLSGRVIAKGGAEGVQAIGIVGRGVGVAIKVEDGADRPLWPVCISILQRLGVLPESLPSDFPKAWQAETKNTRGDRVGYVRACI